MIPEGGPSNIRPNWGCTWPNLSVARGTTAEMIPRDLKTTFQTADANWLSALIISWPNPCPPQDDARTFLPRQIGTVVCLEQVHQEWRVESLAAWRARRYSDSKRNTLQQAIQVNARRRMLRDARIVSLLGQLISAWKTHLARGLASLASGPSPSSDERIMRECRVIADKYKTMEDILEATHNVAPGRLASDTPVGRVFSAVPSLGHVRDIISPPERRAQWPAKLKGINWTRGGNLVLRVHAPYRNLQLRQHAYALTDSRSDSVYSATSRSFHAFAYDPQLKDKKRESRTLLVFPPSSLPFLTHSSFLTISPLRTSPTTTLTVVSSQMQQAFPAPGPKPTSSSQLLNSKT
ncbi:hypothetical protein B0H13DRAFT_1856051 [Mycena leptocephala]|nr:hypothetical protein B0H13DRAFT_1856051 [Mycena leptocephala]